MNYFDDKMEIIMITTTTTHEMINNPFSVTVLNLLQKELESSVKSMKKVKYVSFLFFALLTYFGLSYIWNSDFVVHFYLGDRVMPTETVDKLLVEYRIYRNRMGFSFIYLLFTVGISLLALMGLDRLFVKHVDMTIDGEAIFLNRKDLEPVKKIDQKLIAKSNEISTMYQNILNQAREVRKFEYAFMKKLAKK